MKDKPEYIAKKEFFDRILTIYGRKPVLEALSNTHIDIHKLHLSKSNKPAQIIEDIIKLCQARQADIIYHDKKSLSRISKNSKQDQGVAVDLKPKGFLSDENLFSENEAPGEYIALDGINNPQNLGMIIRSICASPVRGIILPKNGCAKIDSLVIKASAGTLFKARIFRCNRLSDTLRKARELNFDIFSLDVNAQDNLNNLDKRYNNSRIYVLGNESSGVSNDVEKHCNHKIRIPMNNQVESLNVAVTASLIAFRSII